MQILRRTIVLCCDCIHNIDFLSFRLTHQSIAAFTPYYTNLLHYNSRLPECTAFRIVLSSRTSLAHPSHIISSFGNSGAAQPRRSFYFYIPHERLRPGGHLQHIFLSTPSPAPLQRSCADSNSKDFSKDRSYGTAQTVKPSARLYTQIFFRALT